MHELHTARPVSFLRAAPEVAFGIQPVRVQGNNAEGTMLLGSWARDDAESNIHRGALGVLVDDVTAYAALTARDEDQFAVSSAITIDFHSGIPLETSKLHCNADVISVGDNWGFSIGQVTTADGALIATVNQRVRYLNSTADRQITSPLLANSSSLLPKLDDLLPPGTRSRDGVEFALNTIKDMGNGMGNLHGGVSICVAEIAVRKAWMLSEGYEGESINTSSIRTAYLRPGNLADDMTVRVIIFHSSRSMVLANVEILNSDGKVAVQALVTLHRSPRK